MNLAILIGRFPPGVFGGAELQAEGWARQLADRHRVTVITRRERADQPAREEREGFRVVRLGASRIPIARTVRDVARIGHAVETLTPRPDLLLCFQTFVSGLAGTSIQRRLGIPAVVWIRGETEYRLQASLRARWFSLRVWRAARGVLVQSDANRAALLEEVRRVSPADHGAIAAKLDVVPNGLDLPVTTNSLGGGVLSVGRLIRDKGMDTVIDAVSEMQGPLTIAGDGPERRRLEARARFHGLDVRFEGFVSRERLAELYRDTWCVVLASRAGEGLPNVVLEAFACARALVATPVAGIRDLVRDGVNGLLVPPDEPRALREALTRLAQEQGLAERLGQAGRATAEAFAWHRVRSRLEAVLERRSAT